MQKRRIEWLDGARGVGILLVVIGHVLRGLTASQIAGGPFWDAVDYTLYTFHMPLFFVLAGLSTSFSNNGDVPAFLKGKLWTVAYPYFLWSLIQGGVMVAMSPFTNWKLQPQDLLSIGWSPLSQFWFLYVLMVCHLSQPILTRWKPLLPIVIVTGLVASNFLEANSLLQRIAHALPFYALGIWLADAILKPRETPRLVMIGAALALFGLCAYAGWRIAPKDTNALAVAPAAIAGILAACLIAQKLSGRALHTLAALGAASMTIYVLHILFASGARIAMSKLGVPPVAALYLIAGTVIGAGLPYVAHRILAARNLLWPLGLAPMPKRIGQARGALGEMPANLRK